MSPHEVAPAGTVVESRSMAERVAPSQASLLRSVLPALGSRLTCRSSPRPGSTVVKYPRHIGSEIWHRLVGGTLAQCEEFGFVLFASTQSHGLMSPPLTALPSILITISMLTPFAVRYGKRWADLLPQVRGQRTGRMKDGFSWWAVLWASSAY